MNDRDAPGKAHRGTILLVSDDTPVRMEFVGALRRAGFKALQAQNGDQAIGILSSKHDIDAVISDIWMPGYTNGVALAAWLRVRKPDVQIVLMAADMPPLAGLAADFLISKPITDVDLVVDLIPLLGRATNPDMRPQK